MNTVNAVLFDLDGTLLNTLPDLAFALIRLRQEHGMPELPLAAIRAAAGLGSKAMIKLALGLEEHDPKFKSLREHLLSLYDKHLADSTHFFPKMETVLAHLDTHDIPWGIVTNKLTRHTLPLLKALNLQQRSACIVCGDSLSVFKPDPGPILHACNILRK